MSLPTQTEIDGRRLTLSRLDKPLYPDGFTKAQVLDYYARVADHLLPHLHRRPATRVRFPDGTSAASFFEKNLPAGSPEWVPHQSIATTEGTTCQPVVGDIATLILLANLASLEFHIPAWRIPQPAPDVVDLVTAEPGTTALVVDLDPGPEVTTGDLVRAALLIATALADDGLAPLPRASGRKGLQVWCPLRPTPSAECHAYVARLGERLARRHSQLFVTTPALSARTGRIFIDAKQNQATRTMIAPYSLRGVDTPRVCTPLHWEEVAAATAPTHLHLSPDQVLDRLDRHGDLAAPLLEPSTTPLPTGDNER